MRRPRQRTWIDRGRTPRGPENKVVSLIVPTNRPSTLDAIESSQPLGLQGEQGKSKQISLSLYEPGSKLEALAVKSGNDRMVVGLLMIGGRGRVIRRSGHACTSGQEKG